MRVFTIFVTEYVTKRRANPTSWVQNKKKKARQNGQSYLGRNGREIPARGVKPGCAAHCRYKCSSRVTEQSRNNIFQEFWATNTHEKKWDYLLKRVHLQTVHSRTTNWDSRRDGSRNYTFRIDGHDVRVCKTMFLNTLDISEQWLTTAIKKQGLGSAAPVDNRGKHGKHKLPTDLTNSVREHISMFPKVPSHYVRKDSSIEYLEEGLNIKRMYNFYTEWMALKSPAQKMASERQYRDIFNGEFNLSFFKPKKDQCNTCFSWNNYTDEEKAAKQSEMDLHIRMKNLARNFKDTDKKAAELDETLCLACFDMQKVLIVPRGETSSFYYSRKFAVYNFTVYDCTRHDRHCFVWDETIGKKGSNEIASFVFEFIHRKADQGIKKFFFYSDNCSGQNRNRFVFSMYLLASVKFKVDIVHRFLEVGHTQNEGDSMHAMIEKRSKGEIIFVPSDWINLIQSAKSGKNPYNVTQVQQKSIFNFKTLVGSQNWEKLTNGVKIKLLNIRELRASISNSNIVQLKYEFDGELYELNVNERKGRPLKLETYELKSAYSKLFSLSKEKIKDLMSLCKSGTIPTRYHAFYESLQSQACDNLPIDSEDED